MDSPMVGIAARLVRFTAELTCLLCGRSLGTLDGGSSWPPRGEALLYRPGVEQPMPITGWWEAALHQLRRSPHGIRGHVALGAAGRGGGLDNERYSAWPATELAGGRTCCRQRGPERVMTRICDRAVLDQQAG